MTDPARIIEGRAFTPSCPPEFEPDTVFVRCSFAGLRLEGLALRGIRFNGCQLEDLHWKSCRLERVEWSGCELLGVGFGHARCASPGFMTPRSKA